MINLDLTNLQAINLQHGVSISELETEQNNISEYLKKIHARKQGFYEILDDQETIESIKKFAEEKTGKYKSIVVLAIGGSSLGTICLQKSLKHLFINELNEKNPKLYVIDNIDPTLIAELEDVIELESTLFIPVTKSGKTPETLAEYFYFRKKTDEANLDPKEHFVFITDPEGGLLREISKEESIPTFEIPQNVGGRFSVLTPVGLLPAALIGINIESLISGAKKIRQTFLSENFSENLPFQFAQIQYQLTQKGKNMNVMMPYSQKLIYLADWYRQLLAESIGKKQNNKGEEVNIGITPIKALGVTDQHSQSQLYNEGPNDKLLIFIEIENFGKTIKIPNLKPNNPIVNYLKDVSFNKLINIEKSGTEKALIENDRPNITIKIDQVNENSIGELFMFFEAATAFLGEFFNINAFDQPGVELSKNLTKELLLKA